mmetsp:Transcript_374/g.682  ORF Transcript_374/g.682 Transcript_374/m.682 type:complete len:229 (+) Transcript_374:38-724(+)
MKENAPHEFEHIRSNKPIQLLNLNDVEFVQKSAKEVPYKNEEEYFEFMKSEYNVTQGMVDCLELIVLFHHHGHPFVLFFFTTGKTSTYYHLPQGQRHIEESIERATSRILSELLEPTLSSANVKWHIHGTISKWYRPYFKSFSYPYIPAHITKPKSSIHLILVTISEKTTLHVPANFTPIAIPLMDLFVDSKRYGPLYSSIPQMLSSFKFNPIKEGETAEDAIATSSS